MYLYKFDWCGEKQARKCVTHASADGSASVWGNQMLHALVYSCTCRVSMEIGQANQFSREQRLCKGQNLILTLCKFSVRNLFRAVSQTTKWVSDFVFFPNRFLNCKQQGSAKLYILFKIRAAYRRRAHCWWLQMGLEALASHNMVANVSIVAALFVNASGSVQTVTAVSLNVAC